MKTCKERAAELANSIRFLDGYDVDKALEEALREALNTGIEISAVVVEQAQYFIHTPGTLLVDDIRALKETAK